MANFFVRSSDGSDSDNGSTWALAKATLSGALSAASAGDTIFVADGHSESNGNAITLASPGTAASPVKILCVDDTGDPASPTTLATTATITATGATSKNLSFTGFAYFYGIIFTAGTTSFGHLLNVLNSTSSGDITFDNCQLKLGASDSFSDFNFGHATTGNQNVKLINTSVDFTHASQTIQPRCNITWLNTSSAVTGTATPTSLFIPEAGTSSYTQIRGVDLSGMGSNSIINVANAANAVFLIENCKMGSSYTLTAGSHVGPGGPIISLVNCDSGDTNYNYQKTCYQGDITDEATIIRSSGANDGTTGISRKMVSSANANFYSPLISDPVKFWNETIGSVTVTVEVVTDNVTLTDAEAWIEVDYLGTSGFPLSLVSSDRATSVLATPTNQTTSAVTWTTTGLSTPTKQKLSTTFTVAEKGVVAIRVVLAKPSTTMYFCPLVDVS